MGLVCDEWRRVIGAAVGMVVHLLLISNNVSWNFIIDLDADNKNTVSTFLLRCVLTMPCAILTSPIFGHRVFPSRPSAGRAMTSIMTSHVCYYVRFIVHEIRVFTRNLGC